MSATLRTPLAVGDSISYTAGRVTITLQRVRCDAFTVTTYQGTLRIDDNCTSVVSEIEARMIARGYAVLYCAEAAGVAR